MERFDFTPVSITFIGVEGVGKTTMCQLLARRLGGTALSVPKWSSLDNFLQTPEIYAYRNQAEAMDCTVTAYREAIRSELRPIFADNCPDRIHLVQSWRLFQEGMLSDKDWRNLERQYSGFNTLWGPHYVYLHTSLDTIMERLCKRNRPEDFEHNLNSVATISKRWEKIIVDPQWRRHKSILELNGEDSLETLFHSTELWLMEMRESYGDIL